MAAALDPLNAATVITGRARHPVTRPRPRPVVGQPPITGHGHGGRVRPPNAATVITGRARHPVTRPRPRPVVGQPPITGHGHGGRIDPMTHNALEIEIMVH